MIVDENNFVVDGGSSQPYFMSLEDVVKYVEE